MGLDKAAQAEVAGKIIGTSSDANGYFLYGWACEVDSTAAVQVKFWLNRPYPRGTALTPVSSVTANLANSASEVAEISAACHNTASHRFKVSVPQSATNYGKAVFATVGTANSPIGGVGRVHSPNIWHVNSYEDTDPNTDSTAAFLAAIDAALDFQQASTASPKPPVEVHFGAGTYSFNCTGLDDNPCFVFTGQSGRQGPLLITGHESGTMIRINNPWAGFLKAEKYTGGFAITDLEFDYTRTPFFYGTIAAITSTHMVFQIDASSEDLSPQLCTRLLNAKSWGTVMDPVLKGVKAGATQEFVILSDQLC